ncbi:hypothetical protein PR202_ga16016 [Eleusine coracana subsp. coracana]|uniref:Uncharacterized protein n=1 Tax=Eleusine coracana subsp. coracana TaxID=191504 RepID=A0AAV5CKH8_ELECO|nr:hypothetical protein PR202_ga16016 [Eleusine coracana subsp. coracana]
MGARARARRRLRRELERAHGGGHDGSASSHDEGAHAAEAVIAEAGAAARPRTATAQAHAAETGTRWEALVRQLELMRTVTSRSTSTPTPSAPPPTSSPCATRRGPHSASLVDQPFVEDLTISFPSDANNGGHHRIVAFDDLSVTIDVSPSLRAHLVRSCPYVTLTTTKCVVDVALV